MSKDSKDNDKDNVTNINIPEPSKPKEDYSTVKNKIKTELIDPSYYDDIKYNLEGRSNMKVIGDYTEIFSRILAGISSVVAFAAGFFGYNYISFIAGALNVLSLVLIIFSENAMKESKERNDVVNRLLTQLGLDKVVNIAVEPDKNLDNVVTDEKNLAHNADKMDNINKNTEKIIDDDLESEKS